MIDRRKAEVAGYAVAAFVIVLLAIRLLQHDGGAASATRVSLAPPGGTASARGATTAGPSSPRLIVVDVAGEVRRPGVYRVPAGTRVDTAVRQAGGVTRRGESTAVNLAMPLHDGQQVMVPRRGAVAAVTTGGGGTPDTPGPRAAAPPPTRLSTPTP